MNKEEKEDRRRETLGKFFFDLAKASFAVLTLSGVVELMGGRMVSWQAFTTLLFGIIVTWGLATVGNNILDN